MHLYTVEFRILGATVEPVSITSELGLEPCQIRVNGTLRADGRVLTGMWAYNGGQDVQWTSLEEGLSAVLNLLWPLREVVSRYAPGAQLIWWCGHFDSSFDGGPSLSPALLKRLGDFGAELFIDTYFVDEERAEDVQAEEAV